ncbi:MAG: phosphomannose isomerase type II C-terminal cupin domain [Rickettsiales bacterium]|jgi:mannose-6-phosphate isomerase-like protein (cupin superfamily)|nr:phosphomannose isomerase type II C-terminal cupin domain [Rickettsiales bacterium]
MNKYELGEKGSRPWGEWETVAIGGEYCVKVISVSPGASLSLQYHNHRSENWTVAKGLARAEVESKEKTLAAGNSVFIPAKAAHRLANPGETPLVVIEVQTGPLLDEGDIVRLKDSYGRA